MSKILGFQEGKKLALLEYKKNGILSLDSKSLIHFANGMVYYSLLINQFESAQDDSIIDCFIEGFIEGYKSVLSVIQHRSYLSDTVLKEIYVIQRLNGLNP